MASAMIALIGLPVQRRHSGEWHNMEYYDQGLSQLKGLQTLT